MPAMVFDGLTKFNANLSFTALYSKRPALRRSIIQGNATDAAKYCYQLLSSYFYSLAHHPANVSKYSGNNVLFSGVFRALRRQTDQHLPTQGFNVRVNPAMLLPN
jgi:hypothetical protein